MNENSLKNLKPFKKGQSGNANGRPKGAVSVKTRLKQIFRENPEKFEAFVERYLNNDKNEKHVVEMLDGKPVQPVDNKHEGELIIKLEQYGGDKNSS